MQIALFGVAGRIGCRVAAEAVSRGYDVVPVVRNPDRLDPVWSTKEFVVGDVTDARSVAAALKGMEAVISAVGPSTDVTSRNVTTAAAAALIEGAQQAEVRRLLAGSLEIAPGLQEVDAPNFPAHVRRECSHD